MYGARISEKEKIRAIGGESITRTAYLEMEKERRAVIAEEYSEKSLYAKLFDVNDYRSGIATLARDSGWNVADRSFTNQLRNVAKTVAAAPKLIAKTINRGAITASAAPDAGGFYYGINDDGDGDKISDTEFGITYEILDELPEYDDAEKAVLQYFVDNPTKEEIELKLSGLTIKKDGRVEPIPNDGDFEKKSSTYNYQDYRVDEMLTKSLSCSTCETVDSNGEVSRAVQAYVMDYQITAGNSIMLDDDSEDAIETYDELSDLYDKSELESYMLDAYKDLIGGGGDTSSNDMESDYSFSGEKCSGLKDCSQKIIDDSNITFINSATKTALQKIADTGQKQPTLCEGSTAGSMVVEPVLIDSLLKLSEKYEIKISNFGFSSDRGSDNSCTKHVQGRAVDLTGIKRTDGSDDSAWEQIHWNTTAGEKLTMEYVNDFIKSVDGRSDIGVGQNTCPGFSLTSPPSDVLTFYDTCNHLHLDLR
jgi:hypothetical protein